MATPTSEKKVIFGRRKSGKAVKRNRKRISTKKYVGQG